MTTKKIFKSLVNFLLPKRLKESIYIYRFGEKKISNYKEYLSFVKNKKGLEIGGPSFLFKSALPIYQVIKSLDGVDFSIDNTWSKREGNQKYNFLYNKLGEQFYLEATDLNEIANESYEVVLSSNILEHSANPLKAIFEQKRVLVDKGIIILVVPNKANNFDHQREITSFPHLISDYKNNMGEDDLTHLDEILNSHDLSRDKPAGDLENFTKRSLDNLKNRCLHHHVFDQDLVKESLEYCGFQVVLQETTNRDHICLGIKK